MYVLIIHVVLPHNVSRVGANDKLPFAVYMPAICQFHLSMQARGIVYESGEGGGKPGE